MNRESRVLERTSKAEIDTMADRYIEAYMPPRRERIYGEFKKSLNTINKFQNYLDTFDKIGFKGMRRSIKQQKKRKIFVHWYVERNKNGHLHESISELADILFVSEQTVYRIYNGD